MNHEETELARRMYAAFISHKLDIGMDYALKTYAPDDDIGEGWKEVARLAAATHARAFDAIDGKVVDHIMEKIQKPTRLERIAFVDLVAFPVPASDTDNQTIWKLLEHLRRHSIVFKRVTSKGKEFFKVRRDHKCTAETILQAVRDIQTIESSERPPQ
jgi:hypothetical protein